MHFRDIIKQGLCPQGADRIIWNVDAQIVLIQVNKCNEKLHKNAHKKTDVIYPAEFGKVS